MGKKDKCKCGKKDVCCYKRLQGFCVVQKMKESESIEKHYSGVPFTSRDSPFRISFYHKQERKIMYPAQILEHFPTHSEYCSETKRLINV